MPYVERDAFAKVKGLYAAKQTGYAEEFLTDNHPDVFAYLNPPPTAAKIREQSFIDDAARADLVSKLTDATPQQIKDYVTTNVTDLASARALLTKILLALSIVVQK